MKEEIGITVGLCRSCSGKQKKKSVKVELK